MTPATIERLLQLNRDFYQRVATNFDETRGGLPMGWRRLQPWFPKTQGRALRILDVGCGNGRFAWLLDEWTINTSYVGIDADAQLLALAADHARPLSQVKTSFRQADFTTPTWLADAQLRADTFDLVVCFAALHHVPSRALRQRLLQDLAQLVTADGVVILSHWQFLSSERFVRKQIAWQTIGLTENDVEAGDALLPWQQGHYAVRYVHQTGLSEAQQLGAVANLRLIHDFFADGREGNLNLYTVYQVNRVRAENDEEL
ncbi:MAG: class I SAM-dependent methyltransferase [Caldilineaceae bacterium]|nr:class I SAM-dependent methyltransferase [Caldilineaceae bacterium]